SVSVESRMAEMPIATVPPLWSPGDPRASQVCRPQNGSMGAEMQSQALRTEFSLQEILTRYGRQLDSAGWKPVADTASVARTWANAPNGQEVTITVTKLPA